MCSRPAASTTTTSRPRASAASRSRRTPPPPDHHRGKSRRSPRPPGGPDLELLSSCGAERVSGGDEDVALVLAKSMGELADRRRLAGPVDADDEEHTRVVVTASVPGVAEQCLDLLGECGAEIVEIAPRAQALNETSVAASPTSAPMSASSSASHDSSSRGSKPESRCQIPRRLRAREPRKRPKKPAVSSSGSDARILVAEQLSPRPHQFGEHQH